MLSTPAPGSPDKALRQTIAYLQQLANNSFWGAVTVRFENGTPVHIQRAESIIPTKLADTPRKPNDISISCS